MVQKGSTASHLAMLPEPVPPSEMQEEPLDRPEAFCRLRKLRCIDRGFFFMPSEFCAMEVRNELRGVHCQRVYATKRGQQSNGRYEKKEIFFVDILESQDTGESPQNADIGISYLRREGRENLWQSLA
jgi:hypothetical protein